MTAQTSEATPAAVVSPRWRQSLELLAGVLPPAAAAYEAALLHSGAAFERVDQWLGYQCFEVLQGGEVATAPEAGAGHTAEFPLAALLTAAVDGQQWTGLPLVKALLLIGFVMGRPETRLMVTLAEGARRARRANAWERCLPPPLPGEVNLVTALAHCRQHSQGRLMAPAGLSRAEQGWLSALDRWCELLANPAPGLSWILREPKRVEVLQAVELEFDEVDERAPRPPMVDEQDETEGQQTLLVDGHEVPDEWLGGVDNDDALAPEDGASEAPSHHVQAQPPYSDSAETELGTRARRARTGFRTALQNQHLPWVNDQLTPDDARSLCSALQQELVSDHGQLPVGVGMLALAHVTGQMVEQLAQLSLSDISADSSITAAGFYRRWVPRQSGAWVPAAAQQRFLRPKATHVRLGLPSVVQGWLVRRLQGRKDGHLCEALGIGTGQAIAQARSWLTNLRRQSGGLQTLARVEWWLSGALYQARLDHVPAQLLCAAQDAQVCPAAYYRAYRASDLEDLHRSVLRDAGWQMPDTLPADSPSTTGWVGSNLNPGLDAVATLWSGATDRFERMVQDEGRPLHERHNAREMHEVLMLIFQTMHRLVGDPLESLAFMDLGDRRRLVIADKQQGDARVHRMVPLAALAHRQCQEHVEHVRRLVPELCHRAPETAWRLTSMLTRPEDRAAPFRFLLDDAGRIVRLTPRALREALAESWPLPLNLGRHFVSTWLLEQGVSDRVLVAFLGHHDLGTQSLSAFSPVDFETLFGSVRPLLDQLNNALGLRSIPTFLTPVQRSKPFSVPRAALPAMAFGHERRETRRARQALIIKRQALAWIRQQLAGRQPDRLNQDDVSVLFDRARRATPNRRSFVAAQRLEALRDALADWTKDHQLDTIELPAVAAFAKYEAPLHNVHCLLDAAWHDQLRQRLREFWTEEFGSWRSVREQAYVARPECLILTIIVDGMALDPAAWSTWFGLTQRRFDLFEDGHGHVWWRMALAAGNSRLMAVNRLTAEMYLGTPDEAWAKLRPNDVVGFANQLSPVRQGPPAVQDFSHLLARVRDALAADVPGLVLGYADGSLGAVSPQTACLQRASGLWPTLPATDVPDHDAEPLEELPAGERRQVSLAKSASHLREVGEFRRRLSATLKVMERTPSTLKRGSQVSDPGASGAKQAAPAMANGGSRSPRWRPGPLRRLVEALEVQWDDLVASQALPPVCGLVVQWIHSLAKHGQSSGEDYAPKTLRNYWYSWALRVVEEFDSLDPTSMSSAELEELYLQIVDSAEVNNRQHLYAPLRNWHRYLCQHHGADDLAWAALRKATDQGLNQVDANLVHEHEYWRALGMLSHDPAADQSMCAMQSATLVLVYRFGLRISECLGLRHGDLVQPGLTGDWRVHVRGHLYRGLKTDSARRTALPLEPLLPLEQAVLSSWLAHREGFASTSTIQPLFATAKPDGQAWRLLPRSLLALRVAQALRVACADQGIRVHHCRHSYATRALTAAVCAKAGVAEVRYREMLTSDGAPGLRSVWSVAAVLGHATPATTLMSYAHAGHEWLLRWQQRQALPLPQPSQMGDWMAFACGVRLKTWQRARQRRSEEASSDADQVSTLAPPWRRWSRLQPVAAGRPVDDELVLPTLAVAPASRTLLTVDRIIEHARRFGRVAGLAERCLVPEDHVAEVLQAAAAWARLHRTPETPSDQWWIEPSGAAYALHEDLQVHRALQCLDQLNACGRTCAGELITRYLAPFARMLVIESVEALECLVGFCAQLLDDRRHLALLVPVALAAEVDAALLAVATTRSSRTVKKRARPIPAPNPPMARNSSAQASGALLGSLVSRAHSLGIAARSHGRVAGAREQRHDRFNPSIRCGLRVEENSVDRVRSAKVMARILATVAVASQLRPFAFAPTEL